MLEICQNRKHEQQTVPDRQAVIVIPQFLDQNTKKITFPLIVHKANLVKGIPNGALGIPTERMEKPNGEYESLETAFNRAILEELGIDNPSSVGFKPLRYSTINVTIKCGDRYLAHSIVFNCSPDICHAMNLNHPGIDRSEVAGFEFMTLDEILDPYSDQVFRPYPDSRDILSHMYYGMNFSELTVFKTAHKALKDE